jgi:drug/metabolite transporter (DMT)-like permease
MSNALQPGNALKGIILVVLATTAFAVADVITKHLTMLYAVPLVVALRYLVNLVLLVITLGPRYGRTLITTRRTGLVLIRGACLAAASLTMGIALRYMPVGETVAIIYIAPIGVMLLAVPLLGEKVALSGWIGAATGFLGVLLIVRPGAGLDPIGVTFALINAACAIAYHLFSRVLARTETTIAMQFYTALVGVVVFTAMLPWTDLSILPNGADLLLILALGALAAIGHILFTAAYREAPASLLAPVNYLHLVWAGLLGWLVFHHLPDGLTILGMAMVAGAGIAVALRAHLSRPRILPPETLT